jgi:hypothetical protein
MAVRRWSETASRDRAPRGLGVDRAVPINFLSPSQPTTYGATPSRRRSRSLSGSHFDERDRALIDRRRGDHNRLGFAVQLGTVRFLGTFLARLTS